MNEEPWYSARCVFRHAHLEAEAQEEGEAGCQVFEERIILVRATSFEDAIRKAELEAEVYAKDGIQYLGLVQAFQLFDAKVTEGTEVFSLMRTSPLEESAYLNRFFDSGTERER